MERQRWRIGRREAELAIVRQSGGYVALLVVTGRRDAGLSYDEASRILHAIARIIRRRGAVRLDMESKGPRPGGGRRGWG
jgi:hypothetical protein